MPLLPSLLLAAATAPVVLAAAPADRLAVEGIGLGDPEGRLITLMPTARCSSVEGAGSIAERWCRMPEQQVFGVTPDSLTASLAGDRVLTLLARVSGQRWPRLRANLVARLGEPQETFPSAPATGTGSEATAAQETLRWVKDGSELVVGPGPDGHMVLALRPAAGAAP